MTVQNSILSPLCTRVITEVYLAAVEHWRNLPRQDYAITRKLCYMLYAICYMLYAICYCICSLYCKIEKSNERAKWLGKRCRVQILQQVSTKFFYSISKKDTNKDSMKKKGNRGRGKRRGAGNTDSGGCTVYNIVQIL